MVWPFRRREARAAEPTASYTDVLAALLVARAEGTAIDPAATAALETAAGLVSRAFAVASIGPASVRTAALMPSVLACAGRELIRREARPCFSFAWPKGAYRRFRRVIGRSGAVVRRRHGGIGWTCPARTLPRR